MIGLLRNGTPLHLPPNFGADWEYEDDILQPNQLGQAYTWTLEIPIKGNEWAFHHASAQGRSTSGFKAYDGFTITFDGNLWWECTCDLLGTSPSGRSYKIQLTSLDGVVFDHIRSQLTSIFEGQTYTVGSSLSNDGLFEIPHLHFVREGWSEGWGDWLFDRVNAAVVSSTPTMPCWNLYRLLKLSIEEVGYKMKLLQPDHLDNLKKRLIVPGKFITNNWVTDTYIHLDQTLPDLTLSQLMRTASFVTGGGKWSVDRDRKEITLQGLTPVKILDARDSLHPEVEIQRSSAQNVRLSYPDFSEDVVLRNNPTKLTGTQDWDILEEWDDYAEYLADGDQAEGNYGFCRLENAFYKWQYMKSGSSNLSLRRYAHPFMPYESGKENQLDIQCPCLPCGYDKYQYIHIEGEFATGSYDDGGTDKLYITADVFVTGSSWQIAFVEQGTDPEYDLYDDEGFVDVNQVTSDNNWELDLVHTASPTVIKIIFRRAITGTYNYLPQIGAKPIFADGDTFTPRIVNWHPDAAHVNDGLASASHYHTDSSGTVDTGEPYSLNINYDTYNLVRGVWKKMIATIRRTRVLIFRGFLSPLQLRQLQQWKFLRHREGIVRVRKVRTTLTDQGAVNQEIEGHVI